MVVLIGRGLDLRIEANNQHWQESRCSGAQALPNTLRKQEVDSSGGCAVVRVTEAARAERSRQPETGSRNATQLSDTEVGQRSGRGMEVQVEAVSTQQDTEEAKASGTRDCTRPGVNQADGIRQRGLTPERRTRENRHNFRWQWRRGSPVPIPNTEVKPFSADGTWLETARESRSPPDSK